MSQLQVGKNPLSFFQEVRSELIKVVWPTRQETLRLTVLVIAVTVIVAAVIGALDFIFTKTIEFLILNF